MAEGSLVFAYGWTEPDIGADLASVKTTLHREGDNIVINGEKRFCSSAEFVDYIYVLGRSGEKEDRHKNLSFVMAPPLTPGVTITRIVPFIFHHWRD